MPLLKPRSAKKPCTSPPPAPYESQEQRHVIEWAAWHEGIYPVLKRLYSCPNGGYRSKKTAAMMKLEGAKAGVPDLCLPAKSKGFSGLYIEMKRIKGGQLSDEQRDWLSYLNAAGYKAIVCKGADEAIAAILDYLQKEAM